MQHNMYYHQQPSMAYAQSPYSQPSNQPIHNQHQQMTAIHHGLPNHPTPPSIPPQHTAMRPQGLTNSPRPPSKIDVGMQRPVDAAALQRTPTAPVNSQPNTPSNPPQIDNTTPQSQGPGPSMNPNAAPGPIPATTPLVVRQDNNGVQWIAFEYSRDRVKMEYTIRCDVESVNVDGLDQTFKEDNCVYPRACGPRENYRGNRLVYETECNTVGWSLAQLNPCLRGKRGLIQRAVDSWRNSNSDSKLRSRRVRRMNKMNNRKQQQQQPQPQGGQQTPGSGTANHVAGVHDIGTPTTLPQQQPSMPGGPQMMSQIPQPRAGPPSMQMATPPHMQHSHLGHDPNGPGSHLGKQENSI